MRDVLARLCDLLGAEGEALLCQVVETKGSTPQKAGAWMLVGIDGTQVGTLGGGCVEAEVKQKAIRLLGQGGAEVQSYVLDHDHAWADGLICGGKMVILAQSLKGEPARTYFETVARLEAAGRGWTEAVVLDGSAVGTRCLFDARGDWAARFGAEDVDLDALPVPLEERPRPFVQRGVAWLPRPPRIRLVVVGAGHVGQAVCDLAARCDFDVWVVDDRKQYANADRFPRAQRIVVGPIEATLAGLDLDAYTYGLVVTRGHGHDAEALFQLAKTPAVYLGLIGSRRKIRMIFDTLREQGITEEQLARVSAPVGLDIGSETVTEIAVSIVAELVWRRNRGPGAAVGNAFALASLTGRGEVR